MSESQLQIALNHVPDQRVVEQGCFELSIDQCATISDPPSECLQYAEENEQDEKTCQDNEEEAHAQDDVAFNVFLELFFL